MTSLEEHLRQLIRDEIRRIVRPAALADELGRAGDDLELRERANAVATRLRRARIG